MAEQLKRYDSATDTWIAVTNVTRIEVEGVAVLTIGGYSVLIPDDVRDMALALVGAHLKFLMFDGSYWSLYDYPQDASDPYYNYQSGPNETVSQVVTVPLLAYLVTDGGI